MAFVFQAKNISSVDPKTGVPGPADYDQNFQPYSVLERNSVPFLTSAPRFSAESAVIQQQNPPFETMIRNSKNIHHLQHQHSLLSKLSFPDDPKEIIPINKIASSANFVSRVERFVADNKEITPGPGAYHKKASFVKQNRIPFGEISRNQVPRLNLKRNQSVPSIPSKVQSHGYTEEPDGELILNELPIEEVQELPGGRCHDRIRVYQGGAPMRRMSWSKYTARDLESYIPKVATMENALGPGTYRTSESSVLSLGRRSVAFSSITDRSSYLKMPLKRAKSTGRITERLASVPVERIQDEMNESFGLDDDDGEDEYVRDATPGPGHYYNASTASSFRTQGTRVSNQNKKIIPRFSEKPSVTKNIGPGEYQIVGDLLKKNIVYKAVAFQSQGKRFRKQKVSNIPGPGSYNVKIGGDIQKTKSNLHLNNLGGLTQRFVDPKTAAEEDVGPGLYNPKIPTDIMKETGENIRPSANFISRQNRSSVKREDEQPAVGAYNPNYGDIGIKMLKEEEENATFGVKKPGFNSSKPRFPEKKEETEEKDEEFDWHISKSSRRIPKKQPKTHIPFTSKTKRLDSFAIKNINPGPGAYHDQHLDKWNRPTYNIQFVKIQQPNSDR